MRPITGEIANKLTACLWNPAYKQMEIRVGKRTAIRRESERLLHDRLETRVKLQLMLPLQWRMDTALKI
jgi:hypothetical protein